MAGVTISGKMENDTTANGKTVIATVMVFSIIKMETAMKVNFMKIRSKDMEYTDGSMAGSMKAGGTAANSMAWESSMA